MTISRYILRSSVSPLRLKKVRQFPVALLFSERRGVEPAVIARVYLGTVGDQYVNYLRPAGERRKHECRPPGFVRVVHSLTRP